MFFIVTKKRTVKIVVESQMTVKESINGSIIKYLLTYWTLFKPKMMTCSVITFAGGTQVGKRFITRTSISPLLCQNKTLSNSFTLSVFMYKDRQF